MSMFNLQASYFAIENPWRLLQRYWRHYPYSRSIRINQRDVEIHWTRSAERELQRRAQPLIVELQLYFSCVVKKRVLFPSAADFDRLEVNRNIEVAFRPIASAVCDPREFAAKYPQGREFSAGPALKMVPRWVEIDYRRGNWLGEFGY